MPLIEMEQVRFSYYDKNAKSKMILDGVDFKLSPGELVVILGESGAGKSTFLDLVGLLSLPSHGQVKLESKSTTELKDKERALLRRHSIGFVFQSFNLIDQFSAIENVALASSNPWRVALESARTKLSHFDIDETLFDKKPTQLSVGQCQRIAIARSVINNPRLILADEPTGNLDAANASRVVKTFRDLATQGKAIIVVTHDERISAVADRVLYIHDRTLSPSENGL